MRSIGGRQHQAVDAVVNLQQRMSVSGTEPSTSPGASVLSAVQMPGDEAVVDRAGMGGDLDGMGWPRGARTLCRPAVTENQAPIAIILTVANTSC